MMRQVIIPNEMVGQQHESDFKYCCFSDVLSLLNYIYRIVKSEGDMAPSPVGMTRLSDLFTYVKIMW